MHTNTLPTIAKRLLGALPRDTGRRAFLEEVTGMASRSSPGGSGIGALMMNWPAYMQVACCGGAEAQTFNGRGQEPCFLK